MGCFLCHIFQNPPLNESIFCRLHALAGLGMSGLLHLSGPFHKIPVPALFLCAFHCQAMGFVKLVCEIDVLIYSLLKGPHNWDRRADFQITFLPTFLLSHSIVYGGVG